MNNARMELLRKDMYALLDPDNSVSNELLNKSRELDKLILFAMKTEKYSKTILGDGFMREFGLIVDKIQLFDKIYDSMRIVDPVSKKVLEIVENIAKETDLVCYDFWKKNQICENCISIRAYNEDDTVFKIEHSDKNVYMITAVPINIGGKRIVAEFIKDVTGSLYLGAGKQDEDNLILTSFEHMNQAVVKDELTRLYNRRFINERLPSELFSASIKNQPLSLLFADIDHFKHINDKYGHIAGDQVLKEFAAVLSSHVRNNRDWIARYGGEEFLICLPDTDLQNAKAIAERMRTSVLEKEFVTDKGNVRVTCSIGVHSVCNETECFTVEGIIDLVDKKLYQAKNGGRNRVV